MYHNFVCFNISIKNFKNTQNDSKFELSDNWLSAVCRTKQVPISQRTKNNAVKQLNSRSIRFNSISASFCLNIQNIEIKWKILNDAIETCWKKPRIVE